MSTLRTLLIILAAATAAYWLFRTVGYLEGGLWVAGIATVVVLHGLLEWVLRESRRGYRREREAVWDRRDSEVMYALDRPVRVRYR